MCGESMRLVIREDVDRVPGMPETYPRELHEWTCPECDYFEEATEDET